MPVFKRLLNFSHALFSRIKLSPWTTKSQCSSSKDNKVYIKFQEKYHWGYLITKNQLVFHKIKWQHPEMVHNGSYKYAISSVSKVQILIAGQKLYWDIFLWTLTFEKMPTQSISLVVTSVQWESHASCQVDTITTGWCDSAETRSQLYWIAATPWSNNIGTGC